MAFTEGAIMPTMPLTTAGNGGNCNDGFGFGGGWAWIILFFLFAWGGNGWGFNRGGGSGNGGGAVDNYVLASDFAGIERKIDSVNNGLCDGFYSTAQLINGVQASTAQGFANAELSRCNQQAALMAQLYGMSTQQQNCCCETREAIQGVNYNLATQGCDTRSTIQNTTRDIVENQNSNTRAILDALTAQRIEQKDAQITELTQKVTALNLAQSQAAQNNYIIGQLRPSPIPAYQVQNPYTSYGYGCGCSPCAC